MRGLPLVLTVGGVLTSSVKQPGCHMMHFYSVPCNSFAVLCVLLAKKGMETILAKKAAATLCDM